MRLQLCRAAIAGVEEFSVCDIEGRLPAPTYTASTLEALALARPDHDFVFLVGADQFLQFPRWHRPGRILELAEVWVFPRPGHALPEVPPPFRATEAPLLEIGSTWLRAEFAAGRPPRFLVPDAVLARVLALDLYIESEG